MIARRSVWTDERVVELLAAFVPVADEVGRLQRGEDRECRYFQSFAELGHYGGRTEPSDTRQGIYMVAPSGRFLASVNSRRPEDVLATMQRALAAWAELPREERLLADDPSTERDGLKRYEARFPAGGAALRVTVRDLTRDDAGEDWRSQAWNEDWAWVRPEELEALASPPERSELRATGWAGPESLARRLARAQFVDFARGQTTPFRDEHVERAELRVTLAEREGGVLVLRLEGGSRTAQSGRWRVAGFDPEVSDQSRGLELEWRGEARYDKASKRFESLELVARGTRWGGTQFNARHDDLAPTPIGFVLELVHLEPAQLVAPAHLWAYGW
ncbi:MAG TPA: hypothetical protein VMT18_06400 [Planctomycetota bacterium]|nr:hypothetical protein [Planctomycetota bacterium]